MTDQEMFLGLARWNYWDGKPLPNLVSRKEVGFLKTYLDGNLVEIVKGPRRSGKTSIVKLLYKELVKDFNPLSFFFVNLEDVSLVQERQSVELLERLYKLYRQRVHPSGKAFIFIDEVQRIPKWERWVETYRESNQCKFVITGSSSKLSSKEGGTLLTGRHVDLTLYPFSFRDFVQFKNIQTDLLSLDLQKNLIKNLLFSYLKTGGFPEVLLNYNQTTGAKVLESYFDDIIYKDIVDRWEVRDTNLLKAIAVFMLKNSGNLITYRQIKRLIEQRGGTVSTNTVSEHISHLVEAYMIFESFLYTNSIKKNVQAPKKIYSIDTGLRNVIVNSLTEDFGRDAENVVFIELLRRGYNVSYWKSDSTEVDFIAMRKDKNLAINVTFSNLENEDLKKRELKGLIEFRGSTFKRLLITEDVEDEIIVDKKKIIMIPLWKWLLMDENKNSGSSLDS